MPIDIVQENLDQIIVDLSNKASQLETYFDGGVIERNERVQGRNELAQVIVGKILLSDNIVTTKDQLIELLPYINLANDTDKQIFDYTNTCFASWAKTSESELAQCNYDDLLKIYDAFGSRCKTHIESSENLKKNYFTDMFCFYLEARKTLSEKNQLAEYIHAHIMKSDHEITSEMMRNMLIATGLFADDSLAAEAIPMLKQWIGSVQTHISIENINRFIDSLSEDNKFGIVIAYLSNPNTKDFELKNVNHLLEMFTDPLDKAAIVTAYFENPNTDVNLRNVDSLMKMFADHKATIAVACLKNPNTNVELMSVEIWIGKVDGYGKTRIAMTYLDRQKHLPESQYKELLEGLMNKMESRQDRILLNEQFLRNKSPSSAPSQLNHNDNQAFVFRPAASPTQKVTPCCVVS